MKSFTVLNKCLFLALGLLLICGCEAIQDVVLTESPERDWIRHRFA